VNWGLALRHAAVLVLGWPLVLILVALGAVWPLFMLVAVGAGYGLVRLHQHINRWERRARVAVEFERITSGLRRR
jgi:hypothetical protein